MVPPMSAPRFVMIRIVMIRIWQCVSADEATAQAHTQLEAFRVEMKELGYEQRIKDHVKIGAYCPAMIADSALTFLGTPCEDRDHALEECIKGLSETCKFEKKAMEKMMETVKKSIKKAYEDAKKEINNFPAFLRPELPRLNIDALLKPIKDIVKQIDCNKNSKLQVPELTVDLFTNMKSEFQGGLAMLKSLRTDQASQFETIVQNGQLQVNDHNSPQQPQQPSLTFQGHTINPDSAIGQDMLRQLEEAKRLEEQFSIGGGNIAGINLR